MTKLSSEAMLNQLCNNFFQAVKSRDLSHGAKKLYTFLCKEMYAAFQNNQVDDNGRYYVIYKEKKLMEDLNIGIRSLYRYMAELKRFKFVFKGKRKFSKGFIYFNFFEKENLLENQECLNFESNVIFKQLNNKIFQIIKSGELSDGAKTLYILLCKKMYAAFQNNQVQVDKNGQYYIIYPLKEQIKDSGESERTLIRHMNELRKLNFVFKKIKILGHIDHIYLTSFPEDDFNPDNEDSNNNGIKDLKDLVEKDIFKMSNSTINEKKEKQKRKEKRKVTKEKIKEIKEKKEKSLLSSVIMREDAHERGNATTYYQLLYTIEDSTSYFDQLKTLLTEFFKESSNFSEFSKQKLLDDWKNFLTNEEKFDIYGQKYEIQEIFEILKFLVNKKRLSNTIVNQGKNTLRYFFYKQIKRYEDFKSNKLYLRHLRHFNNSVDLTPDDLRNDIFKYLKGAVVQNG